MNNNEAIAEQAERVAQRLLARANHSMICALNK